MPYIIHSLSPSATQYAQTALTITPGDTVFGINPDAYRFTVRPLSKEEGGGYLVEYPDIPGCMSDGETIEEEIANGREALRDCLDVFAEPVHSNRNLIPPTPIGLTNSQQRR